MAGLVIYRDVIYTPATGCL